MEKQKVTRDLDDSRVNFVCPRCQRIYYQADMSDFNLSREKVTRDARMYKSHYHSCNNNRKNTRRTRR